MKRQEQNIQQARAQMARVKMGLITESAANGFSPEQAYSPMTEKLRVQVYSLELADQLLLTVLMDPSNLREALAGLASVYAERLARPQISGATEPEGVCGTA